MAVTGKFNEFVQGIKENASNLFAGKSRTRDLNGGDTKANSLFQSKKPSQTNSASSKDRSHSLCPKNHVVRDLVRSVVNKVLAKLQHPQKVAKDTTNASISLSTKEHQKFTTKDRFLTEFRETVLQPLRTSKNSQNALKATIEILEKANTAGILTQDLYVAVTKRLEISLNNDCRRQSISLDNTASQKSVHSKLLELSNGAKKFEKFAHIEELSSTLAEHLEITPDEAKQHVQNAFENYPNSKEITLTVNKKELSALLIVDDKGIPDLQIKGKHLASGASSVVHQSYSVRNQTDVATKYATALAADADEEKQAKKVQEHILQNSQNPSEGIAERMTLVDLKTQEGSATVATGHLYAADASTPTESELLLSSEQSLEKLTAELKSPLDNESKATKIREFFQVYGPVLTEKYGAEAIAELRSSLETL